VQRYSDKLYNDETQLLAALWWHSWTKPMSFPRQR